MAITVPASDRFLAYTATAGQTVFAYNFPVYAATDLNVFQITTAGVITELTTPADFTVSDVGEQTGGNVTLVVGATLNENIVIAGDLPELKASNFNQAGDFYKDSINTAFSKIVMMAQQNRRDVDRSIHLDPADITDVDTVSLKLPLTDDRKGKYLFFDGVTGAVTVTEASGVAGPASSADKEVALFSGTDGQTLQRPGTEYMIMPQGTDAQRGAPANIVMRGNTTGADDVEVYVNGGWSSVLTGGTGAPIGATYITQTPNGTLTSEQAMSNLATGIVKNTTTTGVQSIAVDGTDYISSLSADPAPELSALLDVKTHSIFTTTANGNVRIAPNGTGNVDITAPILFTAQAAPAYSEGKLFYSSTNNALSFYNSEPDITLQIGQESLIRVYNNSGGVISNGAIVYASGKENTEDRLTVALAQADSAVTSRVLGTSTHDIADNSFGFITQFGYVHGVDTSAFADGDTIFLSPTTAGGYTTVEPSSPNISVFLGFVVDSDVSGNLFMTSLGNTSGIGEAGDATQLVVPARKGSVGTINNGDSVYVSGYNIGQDVIEVELADNSAAGTMPAIGIAEATITNAVTGNIVVSGRIASVDTSAFTAGDEVYIGAAGALTNIKPTGTDLIQRMGIINRSHGSNGVIDVAATRSNDIPNFSAADKYWYGGGTGTATEGDITAFGRSLIDDSNAAAARTTLGLGTGNNVSFLNGDFTGTESLKLPVGTTAQRPGVPAEGDFRINTTLGTTEVYRGAVWIDLEAASAGLTAASQTEMEAATSNTVGATPLNTHYHPGVAKAWVQMNGSGTPAVQAGYNVASITDNGTGDYDVNFTTNMSSTNYCCIVDTIVDINVNYPHASGPTLLATTDVNINTTDANGTSGFDFSLVYVACFGDQ